MTDIDARYPSECWLVFEPYIRRLALTGCTYLQNIGTYLTPHTKHLRSWLARTNQAILATHVQAELEVASALMEEKMHLQELLEETTREKLQLAEHVGIHSLTCAPIASHITLCAQFAAI